MIKNANSFLYNYESSLDKKENQDRKICSENYKKFIETAVKKNKGIKGKRVCFYDFVKDALQCKEC